MYIERNKMWFSVAVTAYKKMCLDFNSASQVTVILFLKENSHPSEHIVLLMYLQDGDNPIL